MSISISGAIRNTVNLRGIEGALKQDIQDAIHSAEQVGRQRIEEQTPKDTRALVTTAYSHSNQSSVILGIAGTINGRPYGFAQEYGWHDRRGAPHAGRHMIRDAGTAAAAEFIAFMAGRAVVGGPTSTDLEGGVNLATFQSGLAPVGRGSLGYFVEDLQPYADIFG